MRPGPSLKWLVIDMLPITMIDATGLYTVEELSESLKQRGAVLRPRAGRQSGSSGLNPADGIYKTARFSFSPRFARLSRSTGTWKAFREIPRKCPGAI